MFVGSMDQKKYEKAIADSRVSMSLYHTGSIAGTQGPTIAVMAGKHNCAGFTDKFLTKHGMAEGSCRVHRQISN
jgi:hypothetical protein